MAVIRANRESIDDRFSVLGFTVRTELPLFEIAIATDPELLRPGNRARRSPSNFFTSRLLRALPSQRGEAVYLVPPEVVGRFVGQQRLYFGMATFRESDRNTPVSLRLPDRGTMYVGLGGLTERGLRRSARARVSTGYGSAAAELGWGGDAVGNAPSATTEDPARRGAGNGGKPAAAAPAPYSDGYSDELWKQPSPSAEPTASPPVAAQQAYRAPVAARALTPIDNPNWNWNDPLGSLRAQLEFFVKSTKWYVGEPDTRVMPHAAICQVRRANGSEGGTAFFIAPRLLLTAAHVVDGQSKLTFIPGKNGAGQSADTEPFGRFTVTSADFRKFDGYSGNGDFDRDMALIRVPAEHAAPAGRFFDLVEELNQSRPEGVVVNGYAKVSASSSLIGDFINATIDPDKQHLMGGYIVDLPTDFTFTYDIHTLGGTSGSPVYWIENRASGPRAHMVGVHVSGKDDNTNRGCRIEAGKLAWIRKVAAEWSQTLSFSFGARALSADPDSERGIEGPIPDAYASSAGYGARGLTLTAPEYPNADRFEAAHSGNYRAVTGTRTIDKIVIHITDGGANINGTISWFKDPAAKVSAHYVIGQDGTIVQMVAHNDVAWHAGSANGTSIGIEHVANTKGLNPTVRQMEASSALVVWLCDTYGIPADRAHILGHAEADKKTTHKGCPNAVWNWDYYMELITTRSCVTPPASMPQSLSWGRALEDDGADPAHEPDEDPEEFGITEDIPDEAVAGAQAVRALATETPDYPGASRFAPAHKNNYRKMKPGRKIDRIVIHITAGGPKIEGTIAWFQNGNRTNPRTGKPIRSSAHYIVGRDGEVVQMVHDRDKAHHASQVNKRSIGIEHNANKPYGTNQRDLPPTEPQYQASAKLVAWLCAQHGVPVDREHIVGHQEASPKDNHSCPTSYWKWDHYMDLVRAEAVALGIPAEVGRSIGSAVGGTVGGSAGAAVGGAVGGVVGGVVGTVGRAVGSVLSADGYATALEVVQPYYDPSDPHAALSCTDDAMSREFEEWFVGVDDTRQFPHSAICLLNMTAPDGSTYSGTGFYIGRKRILTCAHNLHGMSSVEIIPGRNGSGSQPFGKATVTSSGWRICPGYGGDGDWPRDLAVIDNAPIQAPNGMWFEFLNATPSDRLPLAVCGYSGASNAIPGLTDIIDDQKQHLHGGKARRMPDPETIDYAILSLMGASGSPVYTVENDGGTLKAKICAVHVSGKPAKKDHVNRGCFITPRKIDWIEGRTTSLSLGATSRALDQSFSVHWHDVPLTIQTSPMSCWAAAASMVVGWRDQMSVPDSEIAEKVPVFDAFRKGLYAHQRGRLADAWNLVAEAPASYTIDAWRRMLEDNGPLYIDQTANTSGAGGHVRVLVGMTSDGEADGSGTTMYMHDPARGKIKLSFADFLALYEGRTQNVGGHLMLQILHAGGVPVGRQMSTAAAFALGASGYGRALGNDGPSDYAVHLIPQPDKNACWAASMAMLLSYRQQASHTPETIADEVGGSLSTSYGWDLIKAAKTHFGFEMIQQPSNASIYHAPRQWAEWLNTYGPLWVVIVGAPHAVVVAGIKGDLDDPKKAKVKILNPWDTRVAFDHDPVVFRPANRGYEDWLPFDDFAADFGNMAESDYGNWRILHLPASAARAQSLGEYGALRLAAPPPPVRALNLAASGERREPIEPSRVAGTKMSRAIGEAGACRWSLDQLEGLKSPATPSMRVSSAAAGDVRIALDDWPAIEGAPTPLPLTVEFRHNNGSVGDVRIAAGMPANLAYGVEVIAKIEDCADADGVARLRVRVDYRFRGLAQGNPDATIELCLRGDGRYERENGWRDGAFNGRDALNPAA